jgi:hypothetical protein
MKKKSKTNSMYKLPANIKTKWLTALRSGKYEQTDGCLVHKFFDDEPSYCCLGVLGKVCGVSDDSMLGLGFLDEITVENKLPKFAVQPIRDEDDKQTIVEKLADMNDNGRSFKQIAAYIDRYL